MPITVGDVKNKVALEKPSNLELIILEVCIDMVHRIENMEAENKMLRERLSRLQASIHNSNGDWV